MQEDFKKYVQSRMTSKERQEFESLLEQDSKVKADFELYREAHFAVETLIAEDLRKSLQGVSSDGVKINRKRFLKWAMIGLCIILLLGTFWGLQQARQFSDASFHRYVQLEDELLFRGGQNQDFLQEFKEAYKSSDEEEMTEIISAHKDHIQSTNMRLMLAEHYWRSGKNKKANTLYEEIHEFDQNEAGESVPVGKSHLNQAYFLLKTGQRDNFQELINNLADPSKEYELWDEAEELRRLSQKPMARFFL